MFHAISNRSFRKIAFYIHAYIRKTEAVGIAVWLPSSQRLRVTDTRTDTNTIYKDQRSLRMRAVVNEKIVDEEKIIILSKSIVCSPQLELESKKCKQMGLVYWC